MNFIEIKDGNAFELTIYKQLRDNAFSEDNSFIADSPKVVNLLLQTDIEVKSLLATQEYYASHQELVASKNIPQLFVATKEVMQSIVGHKIHHNCMMHGIRPEVSTLQALDEKIIMLDEITSTENIGSIARSAAALGIHSYVLPVQGPHPYGRRALRVSMGYVSRLHIHLYDDIKTTIKALQHLGYKVYAAEVTQDAIPLCEVKIASKWVLLMGHEGKGIAEDVLALCDAVVSIEMAEGVKSFNVAVAASIMMYQFLHGISVK